MTYLEVLVEGMSDVPVVREILQRRFGLIENLSFRIHPHRGRGRLPDDLLGPPDPRRRGLLDQLPAKLRGWSGLGRDVCVVVLLDVDERACTEVLAELLAMLQRLPRRPPRVLFRLAIEETESWLIADLTALRLAYPKAKLKPVRRLQPDAAVGAAERLAACVGIDPARMTGADKVDWANAIAPHLNLHSPPSPSLSRFISGIARELTTRSPA